MEDSAIDWGQAIDQWAARVDRLHERRFTSPPRPQPGSQMWEDDRASHPYLVSDEASQRLSVAADTLHGLRCLTYAEGEARVRTYAPYPLLRAALENACTVAWMIGPEERAERLRRRFHLFVASHAARDKVQRVVRDAEISYGFKPYVADPGHLWEQDQDYIGRTRDQGVPDVDALLAKPTRATGQTEIVEGGSKVIAGLPRSTGQPLPFSIAWRGLSGASHGDLWALMTFPTRDVLSGPDPVTDQVEARVYQSPEHFLIWANLVTHAVEAVGVLFDRRRLAFREHQGTTVTP